MSIISDQFDGRRSLDRARARAAPAWAVPILLVAVVLTFLPVCRHAFVAWDDERTIQENPRIQHPTLENVGYYWSHPHLGLYIPVTNTVWSAVACVAQLRGPGIEAGTLDPRIFHAVSLATHALSALLVYALLRRLVKLPWPALAGAMFFALHPLQVEAIAWASGLKDLLCGTFSLLALWQYVLAADAQLATEKRRIHYAAAILAFALAMLSKPAAMVTPALALVIDRMILGRQWRPALKAAVPCLALAVPCAVWTKLFQPGTNLVHVPLWARPLVAADALAFYVYKLFLPVRLGLDYGRTPAFVLSHPGAYLTWLGPALVAAALVLWRRHPAARAGAAAALLAAVAVSPMLGLTPFAFQTVSTVADHYVYLSMLGPAFAVGWAFAHVPIEKPTAPRNVGMVAVAALALLAIRSADQMRFWQDTPALMRHAIEVNPRSWPAYTNLANCEYERGRTLLLEAALAKEDGNSAGAAEAQAAAESRLREAEGLFDRALELYPDNIAARHGRGIVRLHFGRPAQAAEDFAQVLVLRDRLAPEDRPSFYADSELLAGALMRSRQPAQVPLPLQATIR